MVAIKNAWLRAALILAAALAATSAPAAVVRNGKGSVNGAAAPSPGAPGRAIVPGTGLPADVLRTAPRLASGLAVPPLPAAPSAAAALPPALEPERQARYQNLASELGANQDSVPPEQTKDLASRFFDPPAAPASPPAALPIEPSARSRKTVIFYSSIGMGHISAARAIERRIKDREPETQVVLKNIRDFMPRWKERIEEAKFWFIVKRFPDLFTRLYKEYARHGDQVDSLAQMDPGYYDQAGVLRFLKDQNPETVLATHYGSAQLLGNLREQGELRDVKLGWLHTDYVSAFFPRISRRIDRTFLPHQDLGRRWVERGVEPDKVAITGMPLNPQLFEPGDRESFLASRGLDPKITTVVLASGAEGVGNFPAIVESVSREARGPLQIVAVCSNNRKHARDLARLQSRMPRDVRLIVKGFLPHEELLNFIKAADVYITKAGGLSPTEGFAINKPMVILDVYGGHEAENAKFFERLGLAVVNRNQEMIGKDVARILQSAELREGMLKSQRKFRDTINIEPIVDFALDGVLAPESVPERFGLEEGAQVRNSQAALAQLDNDAPGDIELLLSGASAAIRIGGVVYAARQPRNAKDSGSLLPVSLDKYLYGTRPPASEATFGVNYGLAYSRSTLGWRISGISKPALDAMLSEMRQIGRKRRSGDDPPSPDAGTWIDRVLRAGGIALFDAKKASPHSSVELFSGMSRWARGALDHGAELVSYARVVDSKSPAMSPMGNPFEDSVTKRLASYPGSLRVDYENISGTSALAISEKTRSAQERFETVRQDLLRKEQALQSMFDDARRKDQTMQSLGTRARMAFASSSPSGKSSLLSELAPQALETLRAQRSILAAYDEFNLRKLDYFLEKYRALVEQARERLQPRLGPADEKVLEPIFAQIEKSYQTYLLNRSLFGQPKDVLRINAYREFFSGIVDLAHAVDAIASRNAPPERTSLTALRAWASRALLKAWNLLYILGKVARMLVTLHFTAISPAADARLIDRFEDLFQGVRKMKGLDVAVTGRENLPATPSADVVNIYAILHSHPILDNVALSSLGLRDFSIFGAADYFAPKFMADRLDRTDHFIVVGRGREKPIDKALDRLRRGKVRNLVIYPEGSVSAGMFETRPVREKFSYGLIKAIREAGFAVNLTPITFPDNFRIINYWGNLLDPEPAHLRALIHEPVSDEMIRHLVSVDGDQAINTYLRSLWLENLAMDRDHLAGMPKLDVLERTLAERLFGDLSPVAKMFFGHNEY